MTPNPATATETPFDTTFEAASERVRDLNERIISETKKAGNVTLDAYESALRTIASAQSSMKPTSSAKVSA